ncbi:MAG: LysR family transcriptional regulator [Xanthomonadales bacterium]|nr:LysR family transcriptional regulator [Xanthomonadales bacterium]
MDFSTSLDDLYYYAMVVKHGGFAAAGRALGVPKSRLSRHVNRLEERLGVRLLQRSTRRFVVTDTGENLYRHCLAMLAEAESAFEVVEQAQSEPRGLLRVACPIALASTQLAPLIPKFLQRYPKVRLDLHVSNRRVDVLGERFDAALRVRSQPSGEDGLVMRRFAELCELLVASPEYLALHGNPEHPDDLRQHETLSFAPGETQHWQLNGPDGQQFDVEHQPRLLSHNFPLLRQATLDGLGIALLPASVIQTDLAEGRLRHVMPDWRLPQGVLHVVFPSRRGLLPSVRAFIDFLVEEMPPMLEGAA